MNYRVTSVRLIGRNVGDIVSADDYTEAELRYFVAAGLLELVDDAPKPVRRARTKPSTLEET
jgi:hypothetical protein